ncbi:MAG: dynamin family protein, partial [Bacteroidota bacterium]
CVQGKSTLINALLGCEILPTRVFPATDIFIELKWGESPRAVLHPASSEDHSIQIRIEEIEKYIYSNGPDKFKVNNNPYTRLEIFWPLIFCQNGVEFIEAPGLNYTEARDDLVLNYLSNTNAIVLVSSCTQQFTMSDVSFLKQILEASLREVIIVLNKLDQLRQEEVKEVKEYVFSRVRDFGMKHDTERIFFMSSKQALRGRVENDEKLIAESGIIQVEKELKNLILNRNRISMSQFALRIVDMIRELCHDLRLEIHASDEEMGKRFESAKRSVMLQEPVIHGLEFDLRAAKESFQEIRRKSEKLSINSTQEIQDLETNLREAKERFQETIHRCESEKFNMQKIREKNMELDKIYRDLMGLSEKMDVYIETLDASY